MLMNLTDGQEWNIKCLSYSILSDDTAHSFAATTPNGQVSHQCLSCNIEPFEKVV